MAHTHVNLADGLSSWRASAGAVRVLAARPGSGPTERLAGAFLFPNTGPDDDLLGRDVYPFLNASGGRYSVIQGRSPRFGSRLL